MTYDDLPFSKARQLERQAPRCDTTGELKRNCKCRPCIGRRSRAKGKKGQRVARKALGLSSEQWRGREAHEETWTAALRVEVKAGGNMANPVGLRYLKLREQSDASHAIGDTRPFAAVFKPDGWSDVLVVVRGEDLANVVAALLEEWST